MKKIIVFGLVVLIVFVGFYFFYTTVDTDSVSEIEEGEITNLLAPEAEVVISRRLKSISDTLASDPIILAELKNKSEQSRKLTEQEILNLDKKWRSAPDNDPIIKSFIESRSAERIIAFRDTHKEYSEIFVTDARGLNVGGTNRTTDYYQADEKWWTDSFDNGKGLSSHGPIEFDESSQSEAVSLYVPVFDESKASFLGVIKAVLDISAIEADL